MNVSRITRLLELVGLLQSGPGHNISALATACGVTRRTIFRDLQALRAAGLPLEYDRELERYCIPRQYYLPPTNFTPEEALAVIVLCQQLGDRGQVPFYGPARQAALKLESTLPAKLRDHLRKASRGIEINFPPSNPLDGRQCVYEQLVEAVARRHAVRIRYDSLTEWTRIQTKLSPYRLLYSRHCWYVIGRSSLHRATRTFNVGRILDLAPLDERFQVPRGFSIERYLRNAWHLIPEPGPDQEVRIRFKKLVAQNVAEVLWHKTQRHQFMPDGSLDFRVTVSGLWEISWWIMGYADQAEVLQPARLRQMIAERVAAMANCYAAELANAGITFGPSGRGNSLGTAEESA